MVNDFDNLVSETIFLTFEHDICVRDGAFDGYEANISMAKVTGKLLIMTIDNETSSEFSAIIFLILKFMGSIT